MAIVVSTDDVQALTGAVVTYENVQMAKFQVGSYLDLDLDGDLSTIANSDSDNLRKAVVWQAVHLKSNPDALTRDPALQSASANGVAMTLKADAGSPDSLLAPMAMRCIQLLSWNSTGIKFDRVSMRRDYSRPAPPDPWRIISKAEGTRW